MVNGLAGGDAVVLVDWVLAIADSEVIIVPFVKDVEGGLVLGPLLDC